MRAPSYLLLFTLLLSSCEVKISNEQHKPLEWYSFPVSTLQLKDVLDSMVSADANLFYDKREFFAERHLNAVFNQDTIKFLLHFSGDYLDWVTKTDTAYLALDALGRRQSEDLLGFGKALNKGDEEKYHKLFESTVIASLDSVVKKSTTYSIRPLSSQITSPSQWIICKGIEMKCDTFWMIREQKGANTGYNILSDSLIVYDKPKY